MIQGRLVLARVGNKCPKALMSLMAMIFLLQSILASCSNNQVGVMISKTFCRLASSLKLFLSSMKPAIVENVIPRNSTIQDTLLTILQQSNPIFMAMIVKLSIAQNAEVKMRPRMTKMPMKSTFYWSCCLLLRMSGMKVRVFRSLNSFLEWKILRQILKQNSNSYLFLLRSLNQAKKMHKYWQLFSRLYLQMSNNSTTCFTLIPISYNFFISPTMQNYKPINAFTMKPSPAQIGAYSLLILQVVTFYAIIQSRYQSLAVFISMHVIYGVGLSVQLVCSVACSVIDPSDRLMIEFRNNPHSREGFNYMQMLYCDLCQGYVDNSSRHCRICQRCCSGFDHHCMWINNCIGQHNYRWFIAMIGSTFATITTFLVAVCLLWGEGAWHSFLLQMIVIWIASFIKMVFLMLICILIAFHVYLNCKGITTYGFIEMQREKERVQLEKQKAINGTEQTIQAQSKHQKIQIAQDLQPPNCDNKGKPSRETTQAIQVRSSQRKNSEESSSHIERFFASSRSLELMVGVSAVHPAKESDSASITSQHNKNWASVPINLKNRNSHMYSDI